MQTVRELHVMINEQQRMKQKAPHQDCILFTHNVLFKLALVKIHTLLYKLIKLTLVNIKNVSNILHSYSISKDSQPDYILNYFCYGYLGKITMVQLHALHFKSYGK